MLVFMSLFAEFDIRYNQYELIRKLMLQFGHVPLYNVPVINA